jgi:hypothetical protein
MYSIYANSSKTVTFTRWDKTGTRTIETGGDNRRVVIDSSCENAFVLSSDKLKKYDLNTLEAVEEIDFVGSDLVISPDDSLIASYDVHRRRISIFSTTPLQLIHEFSTNSMIFHMFFSLYSYLVYCNGSLEWTAVDIATGNEIENHFTRVFRKFSNISDVIEFSDGRFILMGSRNARVVNEEFEVIVNFEVKCSKPRLLYDESITVCTDGNKIIFIDNTSGIVLKSMMFDDIIVDVIVSPNSSLVIVKTVYNTQGVGRTLKNYKIIDESRDATLYMIDPITMESKRMILDYSGRDVRLCTSEPYRGVVLL